MSRYIGWDIDDTLTVQGTDDYLAKRYALANGLNATIVDKTAYHLTQRFGWTPEQTETFWSENFREYLERSELRQDAIETLRAAKELGFTNIIVTARGAEGVFAERVSLKEIKEITLGMFPKDLQMEIVVTSDKLTACLERGIEYMVDDAVYVLSSLRGQICTIRMHANYNSDCHADYAVSTPSDVIPLIKDFMCKTNKKWKV